MRFKSAEGSCIFVGWLYIFRDFRSMRCIYVKTPTLDQPSSVMTSGRMRYPDALFPGISTTSGISNLHARSRREILADKDHRATPKYLDSHE
jgi:hypothetical protein